METEIRMKSQAKKLTQFHGLLQNWIDLKDGEAGSPKDLFQLPYQYVV